MSKTIVLLLVVLVPILAIIFRNNLTSGNKTSGGGGSNELFNKNYQAPEFTGLTRWLNSEKPFLLEDLRGKVVLVDFWTYTCINCIRTLPHVTSWYDKYKDKGFVVIGVHTPEFEFEKEQKNVEQAIKKYNIHYPVPQDNDYATWKAYGNQYWPGEYLIDAKGVVRKVHFGEGNYDETEKAIQTLLKEAGYQVGDDMVHMPDETPQTKLSPESYLGASRMEFYYPNGSIGAGAITFTLKTSLPLHSFSFGGQWSITDDKAITQKDSVLIYHFYAKNVFLVLRPSTNHTSKIKIFLDDKLVDETNAGQDVSSGTVTIDTDRLYKLIALPKAGDHILRLEFMDEGTQLYAFTFG